MPVTPARLTPQYSCESHWSPPEDSLRFFGVRLYEAGLIKTSPQKLIALGTEWRFSMS